MIFRGNIAKKTQKSLRVLRLVAVWGRFRVSSREFLSFQPLAYTLFFRTEIAESHRNVPLAIARVYPSARLHSAWPTARAMLLANICVFRAFCVEQKAFCVFSLCSYRYYDLNL